jgi:hypothetical protein
MLEASNHKVISVKKLDYQKSFGLNTPAFIKNLLG